MQHICYVTPKGVMTHWLRTAVLDHQGAGEAGDLMSLQNY